MNISGVKSPNATEAMYFAGNKEAEKPKYKPHGGGAKMLNATMTALGIAGIATAAILMKKGKLPKAGELISKVKTAAGESNFASKIKESIANKESGKLASLSKKIKSINVKKPLGSIKNVANKINNSKIAGTAKKAAGKLKNSKLTDSLKNIFGKIKAGFGNKNINDVMEVTETIVK